jgi:SAM-dependent methyltransferase
MENRVVPIAMPGIHEKFYPYLKSVLGLYENPAILEIGSGHGAFTKRLWQDGYNVTATDIFPENFYFTETVCHKVDIRKPMPFSDNSFDIVIAVEVMEHVHDHEMFFSETKRVLKSGGRLIFSTPNILSLKSRVRFLFSGFFYSFNPVDHHNRDGMQHLASLTVDQYNNLGIANDMTLTDISTDKRQRTSSIYFIIFYPFIRLHNSIKKIDHRLHSSPKLLLGRILFFNFRKI